MRNLLFFIIATLISSAMLSQEKRKLITGLVTLDSLPIYDAHIINIKTKIGTISNDSGHFEIPVKLGDTLTISHLNLKNKIIAITKKHLSSLKISISLNEKITSLNEFTLEKPRSIFYVDPTIKIYNGPVVNAKTLGLPNADNKPKVNNAIVRLSSGGVLSIDNLINTLNGNKRRKEIVEKIASEDKKLVKIRKYFTDDFFITDLHIKKEDINPFLNFCLKKNILQAYHKKEHIKLTQILVKESKSFPQKEMSDVKIAFKKN